MGGMTLQSICIPEWPIGVVVMCLCAKLGQWDNGTRCSRVLALTRMAKVRQWLSSGPGLSSDVQPNSIHTLSSALHLDCDGKQWMPV